MSADSVAHEQIRGFVERIERLEEERTSIARDIAEVYAEAKGNGFDRKALKIVVTRRRQDHNERMELEALVELYEAALMGFSPDDHEEPALTRARAPARVREDDTEYDAETGEFTNSASKSSSPSADGLSAPFTQGDVAASSAGTEGEADRPHFISAFTTGPAQPVTISSADPTVVVTASDRSAASPSAAPVANVTPIFRVNSDTHFVNSKGLPRLHGCLNPETCGGTHRALCGTCAKALGQGSAA